MRAGVIGCAVLAVLGLAPARADGGYLTIEGTKQGRLKGDGPPAKFADKTQVLSAELGLAQPAAAGAAGGARVHDPVTFTLRLGPTMPQLFQAAVTNEVLKSVLYEIVRTTPEGDPDISNTIRLTNARITSLRLVDRNGADAGVDQIVVVGFAYGKIEIENKQARVMAADSWLQP